MTKKIKIVKLTPNQLLDLLRNASWDRQAAYCELCYHAKVRGAIPDLSMYKDGDTPEELAHIEKHFDKRTVSALFSGDWDT